ncbi:MAG: signal recognition particle-docking protein FtsY [Burkholderia sp.]|nr:signal recognition particle-docking protein FtsY [Burkholderia sp.]
MFSFLKRFKKNHDLPFPKKTVDEKLSQNQVTDLIQDRAITNKDNIVEIDELNEVIPPPTLEDNEIYSWLSRLKLGLTKTGLNITKVFVRSTIDEKLYKELETALLMSDVGVDTTGYLLDMLRKKVRENKLTDTHQVKHALRELLINLLKPLEKSLILGSSKPFVMLIVGANGVGKTTSIAKLAKHLKKFNQSVLLAAGDTFRAAAREQLSIWGERNGIAVVQQQSGDSAAVIFDAISAARARNIDVMIADTAGRLHTQLHLMKELKKIKRVINKSYEGAPHEIILVIDANMGQNTIGQVNAFDEELDVSGLIITKLDGTAKGGILVGIARQKPIPIYFIGVGEQAEDLQPFKAEEFVTALLD